MHWKKIILKINFTGVLYLVYLKRVSQEIQGWTCCVNLNINCISSVIAYWRIWGTYQSWRVQTQLFTPRQFLFPYIFFFILKVKLLFEQNWLIFCANMSWVSQICARFNVFFNVFFFNEKSLVFQGWSLLFTKVYTIHQSWHQAVVDFIKQQSLNLIIRKKIEQIMFE